jgi:hypothetical protein
VPSVLDTITAFLTGKGLSRAQVAGVEGNLHVESGFNPSAANAKEGAIGLAQWEGGRRTALQRFARARGSAETDLNTQLEFLWYELTTSERSAYSALVAADDPGEAATVFDQKFERSAGTSRQARVDAANDIYRGIALPGSSASFAGVSTSFSASKESFLDKINPFDNWAADTMAIGVKLVGTVGAIALVVVGVMHTVKDGQD